MIFDSTVEHLADRFIGLLDARSFTRSPSSPPPSFTHLHVVRRHESHNTNCIKRGNIKPAQGFCPWSPPQELGINMLLRAGVCCPREKLARCITSLAPVLTLTTPCLCSLTGFSTTRNYSMQILKLTNGENAKRHKRHGDHEQRSISHFPSPPPPSFTQSPSPPRSLVRDGHPSPHRPRLVVSRNTCPPISHPPQRKQLCTRS
jgi:hypothetical protein